MTNSRKEPTLGVIASVGAILGFPESNVNAGKIVEDALKAFTEAEQKMEKGLAAIEAEENRLREEAAAIITKANEAGEHKSRLLRVKERFSQLLA